jgi:cytochrome c oxidase assembly factor CtaG
MLSRLMFTAAVPAAPTTLSFVADWRLDPVVLVCAAGGAWAYLAGVRRVARAGGRWPRRRVVAFVAGGLGSLVWTTMGWPAVYGPVLFSVYATQAIVLLTVVPFLLALGRPLGLARESLRPAASARLDAVLSSRAARVVTVPVVSPLLLAVVPFVVFFTGVYPATLADPALLWLLQLALVVIGLIVLVPLWESDAVAARVAYPVALLFAFIELLADALPGIVIRLDTKVIGAASLAGLGRSWGPSLLRDQQIGGDLLWCIGEAVDVPFLALLLIAWARSDAREAARIDRDLDRAAALDRAALHRATALDRAAPDRAAPDRAAPDRAAPDRAAPDRAGLDRAAPDHAAPASTTGPSPAPVEMNRPWWETDASVFGDRAGQFERPDRPRPRADTDG